MGSRKKHHHKKKKNRHEDARAGKPEKDAAGAAEKKRLEIVLKCDTSGCAEAIISAVVALKIPGVSVDIISSGVGPISKSDVFMAETGSRLILGFNVGFMGQIDQMAAEHDVEIRLYEVIYKLIEDVESIGRSFIPATVSEDIIGTAKVIALFKSSRKGIILGCEVLTGKLVLGNRFRVIDAMGPIYTGTVESLHIEKDAVKEARKGQQVGLKIRDFNKVRIGDLVESFRAAAGQRKPWRPRGMIVYP
jgi:translation initiation factor IF-2